MNLIKVHFVEECNEKSQGMGNSDRTCLQPVAIYV
jgi:hypothetical protein